MAAQLITELNFECARNFNLRCNLDFEFTQFLGKLDKCAPMQTAKSISRNVS